MNRLHTRVHRFSYTARHLRSGADYEALVQARNEFGWSERSEAVRFSTRRDRDDGEREGRRRKGDGGGPQEGQEGDTSSSSVDSSSSSTSRRRRPNSGQRLSGGGRRRSSSSNDVDAQGFGRASDAACLLSFASRLTLSAAAAAAVLAAFPLAQ